VIANVGTPGAPGAISPSRYKIYGELFAELSQKRY
jgi:ribosome biogenesis GTPase